MKFIKVPVQIKKVNEDAVVPKYAHELDAGFDLVATEDVVIEPGETALVKTGLAISIPPGYEVQIRPRSGITLKTKLRVQLGTVDAGYIGEIGVIVDNLSQEYANEHPETRDVHNNYIYTVKGEMERTIKRQIKGSYMIRKGDRIAQAVLNQAPQALFEVVSELGETSRGDGSFGSTGTK